MHRSTTLLVPTCSGRQGAPSEDAESTRADGSDRQRVLSGSARESGPDARPTRR